MDKLTAQLIAGYAPIAGGVALAAKSTTLAIRYHSDLVGMAMFGGFVGGVAVVGVMLCEIAYHWPRPIVSQVVLPPDTKPTTPTGYNSINTRYSQDMRGLVELRPELPPYFNFRAARRVAWNVTVRSEPLTQARLAQVMSKGHAADLIKWMLDERLVKWKGRDYRAGVVVTGAGMDWLETIIKAYGAPPPSKRGRIARIGVGRDRVSRIGYGINILG